MGRPPLGERAMTNTERKRRYRAKAAPRRLLERIKRLWQQLPMEQRKTFIDWIKR